MPEKASVLVKRKGEMLLPLARFDGAAITGFREGAVLKCELSESRSLPRHRLYWAVLTAVVQATGKWPNAEALHHALKIHLGAVEEIASVRGEILIRPKSTSFGKMDEREFREFFDNVLLAITTEVCPGMTVEDLLSLGRARLEERRAA